MRRRAPRHKLEIEYNKVGKEGKGVHDMREEPLEMRYAHR